MANIPDISNKEANKQAKILDDVTDGQFWKICESWPRLIHSRASK